MTDGDGKAAATNHVQTDEGQPPLLFDDLDYSLLFKTAVEKRAVAIFAKLEENIRTVIGHGDRSSEVFYLTEYIGIRDAKDPAIPKIRELLKSRKGLTLENEQERNSMLIWNIRWAPPN